MNYMTEEVRSVCTTGQFLRYLRRNSNMHHPKKEELIPEEGKHIYSAHRQTHSRTDKVLVETG